MKTTHVNSSQKNITLIIGGTGFVGQHLVQRLASAGVPLRVVSRRPANLTNPRYEHLVGDFCDRQFITNALRNVDVVYHLAATTVPGSANHAILSDAETNLMGSIQLMQFAAETGVRRFVYTSTGGAIYGAVADLRPIPETHATSPISAYAVSKLAVEKYLEIFRREFGMEYRIARASNPYGVGQNIAKKQGIIGTAFDRALRDKELVIWGDGHVVRDFFHVTDLANALVLMHNDRANQRLYNVGSGIGRSIRQVIAQIEETTGKRMRVRYDSARTADVPYNCLDITRINRHLGWKPTVPLRSGLAATWQAIQANAPAQTVPASIAAQRALRSKPQPFQSVHD